MKETKPILIVRLKYDLEKIQAELIETDLKAKAPGYLTEEIDLELNAFVAGVGFKYYF